MMNVTVDDGTVQMLSLEEPGPYADAMVNVVPKSLDALRDLVGLNPPNKRINLRDQDRYKLVDDVRDLVDLALDGDEPIQDWKPDFLKAVLLSIGDTSEFPESVKLKQKIRRPICGEPTGFQPREGTWMTGPAVRVIQVAVPSWLRQFQVYLKVFLVNDIVVGRNATLVLSGPSMVLSADNLYIYQGGKIVQQAASVKVNLTGEIQGDLP